MIPSVIYVIQARNGAIKIGHSVHPPGRLSAVRTHSPLAVRLIAILGEGGWPEELALHRRFDHCRSHCEWFAGPEVDAFASEVMGRGVSSIEDWVDLEFLGTHKRHERRSKILKAAWADPERRRRNARTQIWRRVRSELDGQRDGMPWPQFEALVDAECARRHPDLFAQQVAA